MQIPKGMVVERIRAGGDPDRTARATPSCPRRSTPSATPTCSAASTSTRRSSPTAWAVRPGRRMIGPPVRPGPDRHLRHRSPTTPCLRSIACALVRGPLEIRSDGYARGVTATELGLPALRGAARRDPARPADPRLVDTFGRVATDLRISLTDRCNLRCTYCMPAEGLDWMPRDEQLTDDELVRLITIAVRDLGVHELRFTGGEPLLRRGLERIIAASAALRPRPDISLTTNGIGLARRAEALAAAGVEPAQRLARHAAPRPVRLDHPPRPPLRRPRGPHRRPRRGARPRQDQHRAAARRQRRRGRAPAGVRASTRASSCASSSRCRSTPSTAGSVRRW